MMATANEPPAGADRSPAGTTAPSPVTDAPDPSEPQPEGTPFTPTDDTPNENDTPIEVVERECDDGNIVALWSQSDVDRLKGCTSLYGLQVYVPLDLRGLH